MFRVCNYSSFMALLCFPAEITEHSGIWGGLGGVRTVGGGGVPRYDVPAGHELLHPGCRHQVCGAVSEYSSITYIVDVGTLVSQAIENV